MATFTTKAGEQLYYKDWGRGQPIVFSHGWPLSADAWEDQMFFLARAAFAASRTIGAVTADRASRWNGNDIDTYADDLAELVERSISRTRSTSATRPAAARSRATSAATAPQRVAKAVLISAIPPLMLKTKDNPRGTPIEVFDQLRAGVQADRSQFFKDLAKPFYGANRAGAKVSQGLMDSFWLQGMMCGFPAAYECIKAFSETDQTEDLKKIRVPTLILHGDDDQIVPIQAAALLSSKLVKGAILKIYPGAPHGLPSTLKDQVNKDLLEFIKTSRLTAAEPPRGEEQRAAVRQ